MSVLRWEEPPSHGNTSQPDAGRWAPIAAALKERPGEWAVIAEGLKPGTSGPMVTRIKKGQRGCWAPAGAFEARGRSNGDGLVRLYARYVGEQP
jgi:hypothetical protein